MGGTTNSVLPIGARPNFMKIAPFIRAVEAHNRNGAEEPIRHMLVHTGQHYDIRMSESFFEALNIPNPDINLEVGSGSHATQVGETMIAFEKVMEQEKPDWVVVVGDVNATLACSVTAKKQWAKCCHIEAGLRSGDMQMPEEINRLVTDRLADLLLTPDEISSKNLRSEGVAEDRIRFVGNIMIDALESNRTLAENRTIADILRNNLLPDFEWDGTVPHDGEYAVLTLHRPSNVDQREILEPLVHFLTTRVAGDGPLIWPVHPRTRNRLEAFGLLKQVLETPSVILLEPLGYHDMLRLNMGARLMLTDSGGLQEECTVLGTTCLTLRRNTERPVTLKEHGGASVLVGNHIERIKSEYQIALAQERKPERPPLWDGKTAERCLEAILSYEKVET